MNEEEFKRKLLECAAYVFKHNKCLCAEMVVSQKIKIILEIKDLEREE